MEKGPLVLFVPPLYTCRFSFRCSSIMSISGDISSVVGETG